MENIFRRLLQVSFGLVATDSLYPPNLQQGRANVQTRCEIEVGGKRGSFLILVILEAGNVAPDSEL